MGRVNQVDPAGTGKTKTKNNAVSAPVVGAGKKKATVPVSAVAGVRKDRSRAPATSINPADEIKYRMIKRMGYRAGCHSIDARTMDYWTGRYLDRVKALVHAAIAVTDNSRGITIKLSDLALGYEIQNHRWTRVYGTEAKRSRHLPDPVRRTSATDATA